MDRWWAPEDPGTTVTLSDLVLLEPGTDASYDLGASVFAMHRVGAAACLAAADTPLLSESTLVQHLAMARESYAPLVVESISKCLGDVRYAGLLVRDLADDAERGALELFSGAVAKGVAPPLAAQRVGMVYGVPSNALGAYKTLACTPTANPVALQDAADRALFAYVEQITKQEMASQVISKADAAVLDRQTTWVEQDHSRNSIGEFARRAAASQQIKNLLNKKPEPLPRVRREQRVRRVRTKAPTSLKQTATQIAVQSSKQTAQQKAWQKKYQKPIEEVLRPRPKPFDPQPESLFQDPMRSFGTQSSDYGDLTIQHDHAVSFMLNVQEWQDLIRAVKDTGNKIKAGVLDEALGNPTTVKTQDKDDLTSGIEVDAALTRDPFLEDRERPTHIFTRYGNIADEGQAVFNDMVDPGVVVVKKAWMQNEGRLPTDEELGQALMKVSSQPARTGDGMYYIYAPSGLDDVTELRISSSEPLRGDVHGSGTNPQYTLDPNLVLKIGQDSQRTYDPVAQAIVTIISATREYYSGGDDPMDMPIGKADASVLDRIFLEQHNETRDDKGRFDVGTFARMAAASQKLKDAQPAKPDPRERRVRRTRRERIVLQPTQGTVQASIQRATQSAFQGTAQRLAAALDAKVKSEKKTKVHPDLHHDVDNFIMLSAGEMNAIVNDSFSPSPTDIKGTARPRQVYLESPGIVTDLMEISNYSSEDLMDHMKRITDDDAVAVAITDAEGGAHEETDLKTIDLNGGELDQMGDHIKKFLQLRPQVTDVRVTMRKGYEDNTLDLKLQGYSRRSKPTIIRNEIEDPSAPVQLYKISGGDRLVHGPRIPEFAMISDSEIKGDRRRNYLEDDDDDVRVTWWTRYSHDLYVAANTKPQDTT